MTKQNLVFAMAATLIIGVFVSAISAASPLTGRVQLGGTNNVRPASRVQVTLFEATEQEPVVIGRARTDRRGRFEISPTKSDTSSIFFLTADVAWGVQFVTILGPVLPAEATINELTSVAASYSMAQFYREGYISGDSFGLRIAAMMNNNIVATQTGDSSQVLLTSPNADETHSLRMTRSLANLLNGSARNVFIRYLYLLATSTSAGLFGELPPNTAVATANLARDPGQLAFLLYLLSQNNTTYAPALEQRPDAWTVTVKVNDSGDDAFLFGGPANVSFDSLGFAWVANNTVQGTPNSAQRIMVLKPDGTPSDGSLGRPVSPVTGGGILGVGWGIAVDRTDTVWIGNFGWGGNAFFPTMDPIVSMDPLVLGNGSVSKLSISGTPLSEPIGFFGGTWRVQAIKVDDQGNVWCSSFGNDKVVVFPNGDPEQAREVDLYPGAGPFGLAFDPNGDAWVSNSGGLSGLNQSSVAKLRLNASGDLELLFIQNVGNTLKVIDVDSSGNAWVASQGDSTIYMIPPSGESSQIRGFSGGGVHGPWGLTVDSEDNIWVSNFGPLMFGSNFTNGGISRLCGANPATRPLGKATGDPLSPSTGYTVQSAGSEVLLHNGTPLYGTGISAEPSFAPIMRQTSLQVDRAGNIWTFNNWKPRFTTDIGLFDDGTIVVAPDEANPGGDGIIIYVGLAPRP